MKTAVYEFQIKDLYEIVPLISQKMYMEEFASFKNIQIQIIGDENSSLITINEVANFFDVNWETNYEWSFTKSDYIFKDILIAVVHAL